MGRFRPTSKQNRALVEQLALVTQLGLTMAGSIVFCFACGYYLDKWLGTRGIMLVVGILAGIVGGGVTVYRQITHLAKDDEENPL